MPNRDSPSRRAMSSSNWYCGSRVFGAAWPLVAGMRYPVGWGSGGLGGGRRLEVDELVIPGVPGPVEQPGPRLGAEERLARQRPALEVEQLLRRPVALDDEVLVLAD